MIIIYFSKYHWINRNYINLIIKEFKQKKNKIIYKIYKLIK